MKYEVEYDIKTKYVCEVEAGSVSDAMKQADEKLKAVSTGDLAVKDCRTKAVRDENGKRYY